MRVKTGFARRRAHKKLITANKGYRMTKSRLVKVGKESALHAGAYAYNGRKEKKQTMRRLWITRISHSLTDFDISYSQLIKIMKDKQIILDRKILAEIIQEDTASYKSLIAEIIK